jgi:predicted alpha/beta superfamily hydrolase
MIKHATRSALTIIAMLAVGLTCVYARAAEPRMVSPETLPQGFVVLVEDLSKTASAAKPIYFASGANSWNPGDPDYVLSPRSDGRWQYVFRGGELGENVEFKFTLGSWKFVETDPEGQDISNRQFPDIDLSKLAEGERPVIEIQIPRFREGGEGHVIAPEYRPLQVTGNVKRLQVAGGAGSAAGKMRDLLVWLPPGYDAPENATRSYPVLYMQDGQNLFSDHEAVPDEWHMDETAEILVGTRAIEPLIIVGIPHGGDARIQEYVPTMSPGVQLFGRTPAGDDYIAWVASEVMPRVERAFRVRTGPEHTGIGGASAGGLIALHAAFTRPDLFGLVLAESPALQLDAIALDMVDRARNAPELPAKVFIGMGGAEHLPGSGFYDKDSRRHVTAAQALREAIASRSTVELKIVEKHEHNEHAWADRLPSALAFLFGAN